MNLLMLSCRKATELIEKQKVDGLSGSEKVQLKVHIGMCKSCEKYKRDSTELDQHLKQIVTHNIDQISTEKLQKSILENLKNTNSNN